MRCSEVERLISDYSVDNLSPRTGRQVSEHLTGCESCSAELQTLEKVMLAVEEDLPPVEPPAALWNGVRSRITASERRTFADRLGRLFIRPRRAFAYAVALSTVAVMLVVGVFSLHEPQAAAPPPGPGAMEYVQVHVMSASHDPLADRVSLGLVGALPETTDEEEL